ncbi:MAG TPA: type II toxin-antitoxin system HicA family toxin [Candidatus Saccharimonadales bacterium]|nr:type II toxin-antitoxin system HicA family toxin [Candidatus Saccharimonadales bacterium]
MPELPSFTYTKFVKKIKKAGFLFKRQAAGSHEIWFNLNTKRVVTIPHHTGKTFKKGTLLGMIKDTGLTKEEFLLL